jgi:uncharacterized membrane protein
MRFLEKYGILLILLLGFSLRVVNINQSLWLDEAISTVVAKDYSFLGIIFEFIKGDNHPPLFYLILKIWGNLFGFSDITLRFLPILFGTLTILFTYLFLKKLFDKKIAFLGSFLLTISPLHIYYSQEIRMYPILSFWAILLMYLFIFLVTERAKTIYWWLFAVLLIVLMATDYVGVFLLPVFLLIAYKEKFITKKFVLAFLPLIIVFISWIPIFWAQSETAKIQLSSLPGWRSLAGGANLKEVMVLWMKFVLGRISFYPKIGYYLIVSLFSIPVIITLYKAHFNKKNIWLWIYFLTPLIGSFLFSFIIPVFNYFRFIYVLPAFYGLIAVGLFNLKNRTNQLILISLIIIGNIIGTGIYFFDQSNQREQWRQSVEYIEQQSPQLVIFEFPEPFAPFTWYSTGKVEGFGALNSLTSTKELTDQKISNKISSEIKNVILVSYLRDLTDSQDNVQKKLFELGFDQVKAVSFSGVGEVTSYERK